VAKCILIVDDSEPIRIATRHFLESQTEFEVCGEAADGLEAFEKADHLSPDLIILDLAMPRMNGLQTAREMRARGVRASIVLFTMHADAVPPQEILAGDVDAVVSKMHLPELQQQIGSLLVAL
jgi:DNA-binding NarL/FixJ family response regulator